MRDAFNRVEYGQAAEIFKQALQDDAKPNLDTELLHARTLLKLDAKEAVPFLLRHKPGARDSAMLGRWHLYLGIGSARLRDFKESDEHFDAAERLFRSREDRAEVAYQRARRALLESDITAALRWSEESAHDKSPYGKIRAEHLRSFIFAQEERYRDQARSLLRVLDLIGNGRAAALEEWYAAVHTLAVLARELSMPEIWARAEAELNIDISWSQSYRGSYFQALKAIGWVRALQGDSLGCFRYLRQAQRVSDSPAYTVIVMLDRTYFARTIGETQWAANELAAAEDIATTVAWEETTGEERVGLLLLAQLTANVDPKRANYYLARFKDLGRIRSNVHHYAFDSRLDAIAAFSSGVVKSANDENEAAMEQFREAWATFDRIAYDWRAAQTAMCLYRISQKNRWHLLAEEKLEAYPTSWLARESKEGAASGRKPFIPDLTPTQDRVFRMICDGRSTQEICTELQRADNTVRNHIKVILKAFGVNTRAALVAEAARRGVI